jgi:LuxR family maltose regulon positive regulatory protein
MSLPVLTTKLYTPRLKDPHVSRPKLVAQLNNGLDTGHALSLIAAPAGSGKSTLLAEWIGSLRRPAVWLSLDANDNDLARFLTYVVAALRATTDRSDATIGAETLTLLQTRPELSIEWLLTPLINELAQTSRDALLVLDDYHLIDAASIHDSLQLLIERLPPSLHIVIASRTDPPLPLARWRGRNMLTEVRSGQLRFSHAESAELLTQLIGTSPSAQQIAALEARTEGWITGLQLAALSLRGRNDADAFVRAFNGSDQHIADYLVEEVLLTLPDHTREFLMRTAILERMCGSLCDAVTERDDSDATLRALERENIFVTPLDDKREWVRYHHLFADMLRARLHTLPGAFEIGHRRASDWFARHELLDEAIQHAFAARDIERAVDLIERALPTMRQSRQDGALRGWLNQLPDAIVRRRPALAVSAAWSRALIGDLDAVEPYLRDAENGLANGVSVNTEDAHMLPFAISIYRASLAQSRGDTDAVITHTQTVLDRAPASDHFVRGAAGGMQALAHWARGDVAMALRAFNEAMSRLTRAGNIADSISGAVVLADMQRALGRPRAAREVLDRASALAAEQHDKRPLAMDDLRVALADLCYEQHELDAAEQSLLQTQALRASLPENRHRWHVAMARIHAARDDFEHAYERLAEAERLYLHGFFPDVRPISALRARMWIKQGRLAEAWAWARAQGVGSADPAAYLREYEHLTLARLLIAQTAGDGDMARILEARRLLERLLSAAQSAERLGSVNEILALTALALDASDDDHAVPMLQRALAQTAPEGLIRVYVDADVNGRMAALLIRAARRHTLRAAVDEILPAFGATARPTSVHSPGPEPLAESLSAREMSVLRLLCSELSGPDIARELGVSPNTFHTHTRNIYGKLGVNSRQAAIRRAEALGLR